MSEPSIIPAPAAIANAAGVRITETPLNPERVWRALHAG